MKILNKFYNWINYNFCLSRCYWWKNFWHNQIASRFNPRQKWLIKKIPRTWIDKDTIIEIVVLECLKHYVDKNGEDCFNVIDTENESQREFYQEVRKYYNLATVKLVTLQNELKKAWKLVPKRSWEHINKSEDYEMIYGKVNQLEEEISNLKTEIMIWVIQNRESLWT
jgi:hypothetical protein